jgi:glutamine amidotransferase
MFSLNLVLVTSHELWALRYPEHHRLFVLDRRPSNPEQSPLSARSATLAVEADVPAGRTAVVVASEPMDDDPAWRLMAPGELLHVDRRLQVDSTLALPDPPRRRSVDPLPYVP